METAPSKRPKILFLCTTCPFGAMSGSAVRTRHVARLLEKIGPVTMVAATGRPWSEDQLRETRAAFNLAAYVKYEAAPIRTLAERWRKEFDPRYLNTNGVIAPAADIRRVTELADAHDVVWVHTMKLANAFRRFHWPKTVMDMDDFPSRFHASAAPFAPWVAPKVRRWRNAFAWRRREKLSFERFPILTVCKESDRAHFGGNARVHVVPNGFPAPAATPTRPAKVSPPRIGMIGNFAYLPNHDGLKWFVANAWPEVRRQMPDAEIHLIGDSSPALAQPFASQGVVGLGYVTDPDAEIATWSAMIAPTRLGGGSHLKVAEGLARRVPIITTQHGARGYNVEHDKHVLMADTGSDFSRACLRLLKHPGEGERLTAAGWELFNRQYSWDSIGPAVQSAVDHCLTLSRS